MGKSKAMVLDAVGEIVMVRLGDIVFDPNIQIRSVNSVTVSEYKEAMRAGREFPPLILQSETNRLVCGYHRYEAYKGIKEPTDKVPCIYKEFKNDLEVIKLAVYDNSIHGRPLSTWDKKNAFDRMVGLGESKGNIASLLGVTINTIEEWDSLRVLVRCDNGETKAMPVKRSWRDMVGLTVSEKEYSSHVHGDIGVATERLISQLIRMVNGNKIDQENENLMGRLKELKQVLDKVFAG